MTMPGAETLERERDKLYLTDAELIRRIGLPVRRARHILKAWDMDPKSGFPPKDAFFGGRRYWPAVRAYLDRRNRVSIDPPPNHRGPR